MAAMTMLGCERDWLQEEAVAVFNDFMDGLFVLFHFMSVEHG